LGLVPGNNNERIKALILASEGTSEILNI